MLRIGSLDIFIILYFSLKLLSLLETCAKPMKNIVITIFVFLFATAVHSQSKYSFAGVLSKHLDAITHKDLAGIEATVGDSVLLIFPDGSELKSKAKFVDMHKDWFKDSLWTMSPKILNTKETATLAYANVKYEYTIRKPDGSIASVWPTFLLLIFEKQKDGWKLIHDQNTKITAP